jgi:hypothetical protein
MESTLRNQGAFFIFTKELKIGVILNQSPHAI